MVTPDIPENEAERLKNLESYNILDTLPEIDYDNITAIAAEICGTPIALISLLDNKRQWFKSHHGIDTTETPKEQSFCAHAINNTDGVFIVPDTREDFRFHDNPLVTGDSNAIFYAGAQLTSKNGLPLGTLCVMDHKPNVLNEGQIKSLSALSNQVMNLLELRKNKFLLEKTLKDLEEKNHELERFAYIAAHDLKSPLINISSLAEIFIEDYKLKIDAEGLKLLELILSSADSLRGLVDGLLNYSRSDGLLKEKKSTINLQELTTEIAQLFNSDHRVKMVLKSSLETVHVNKTAIHHILMNLVSNAIKYSDKDDVLIEMNVEETDTHYQFFIKDNGPGIAPSNQSKIFKLFAKVADQDKFGQAGHGIGLATVKKIVKKLGGKISVTSELGQGATFNFSIKK
ncbi:MULTISPECIES: ATP-binding protein [unclassified Algibacter]|uniref:sensor histidine kinase n=1 Tax=unclassified Algibacter TaxID=2615009 RepID=UPI00131BADD5|nr:MULTISPECIES: GAF domain-containing sensor histidine kinase [unclassified Algibacter]MCL5126884.1 GAF domain-containing sensor histidine kinase [Algibacter sp. L4_22]